MAKTYVISCDICGRVQDQKAMPPDVAPCRFQTATANYDLVLCDRCQNTATLAKVKEVAESMPGGVVEGAERVPYLVRP